MPIEKKRIERAEQAFIQLQALCDNEEFCLAMSQVERARMVQLTRKAQAHLESLEKWDEFRGVDLV